MGQYYKPVILREDKQAPLGFVYSHDFGSGLKLMEHSWMKNQFVGFIESLMTQGSALYKMPLVWAGDYADEEPLENISSAVIKKAIEDGQDLKDIQERSLNLYSIAGLSAPKLLPNISNPNEFKILPAKETRYLVNHDKKEFVDKTKGVVDGDGWKIHPLPLLTCEGNNRGGGDFRGDEKDLVGRWARDIISVESKKSDIPKDYTEIIFDLSE